MSAKEDSGGVIHENLFRIGTNGQIQNQMGVKVKIVWKFGLIFSQRASSQLDSVLMIEFVASKCILFARYVVYIYF
jgi:hypothetical protein